MSRRFALTCALVLSSITFVATGQAQDRKLTVEIIRRTAVKTNASHASTTMGFVNPSVLEVTQVRVSDGFVRLPLRQIDRRWPASGFGYLAAEDVAVDSGVTVAASARPAAAVPAAPERPAAASAEPTPRAPAPGVAELVIRPEAPPSSPNAVDSPDLHFLKRGPLAAIVQRPLTFRVGGDSIVVPAGFVAEFASIPRALWSELSPVGADHRMAALVHDYLYWFQPCEREEADNLFMIAMKQAGISDLRRGAAYAGVRLQGGDVWNANRAARDRGDLKIAPSGVMPTAQESLSEYRARLAKADIRGTPGRMPRQTYCEQGKAP